MVPSPSEIGSAQEIIPLEQWKFRPQEAEAISYKNNRFPETRENQDDYYLPTGKTRESEGYIPTEKDIAKGGLLYLVADGVGGAKNGAEASRLVSEVFSANYYQAIQNGATISIALNQAFTRVQDEVKAKFEKGNTTLTGAVIHNDKLYIPHAGDSRLYLRHGDGKFEKMTADQNLLERLIASEALTEEEAAMVVLGLQPSGHELTTHFVQEVYDKRSKEKRNIYKEVEGMEDHELAGKMYRLYGQLMKGLQGSVIQGGMEITEYDLQEGDDMIVLCTDGLTGGIRRTMSQGGFSTVPYNGEIMAFDHFLESVTSEPDDPHILKQALERLTQESDKGDDTTLVGIQLKS